MNIQTFKIERLGSDGEGIAYLNKKPVFIYYTLIGEIVEADLFVNKRGAYEAKLINIIKKSPLREDVSYKYYMKTGSINLLHLKYFEQIKFKRNVINFLLSSQIRKETNNTKVNLTIKSPLELNYRNKTDVPLIYEQNKNHLATYVRGSNNLIKIDEFIIEDVFLIKAMNDFIEVLNKTSFKAYNFKTKKGEIYSISLRCNLKGNVQLMINVSKNINLNNLIKELTSINKDIVSIYVNVVNNYENNLDVYNGKLRKVFGDKYLEMKLNEYFFYLTPLSFFQLNTRASILLYEEILKQTKFNKNDLVLDAFSGVGTIASFISPFVKEVVAIESIKDATLDMEYSLKKNNITNVKAITGDMSKMTSYLNKTYKFDKVLFDPPRVGLERKVINYLLKSKPKEIIYVSCNPKTLVRDLKLLSKAYNIISITPIDLFPQTSQIESITILKLK